MESLASLNLPLFGFSNFFSLASLEFQSLHLAHVYSRYSARSQGPNLYTLQIFSKILGVYLIVEYYLQVKSVFFFLFLFCFSILMSLSFKKLFIYLVALGLSCGIWNLCCRIFSCGMWDLQSASFLESNLLLQIFHFRSDIL